MPFFLSAKSYDVVCSSPSKARVESVTRYCCASSIASHEALSVEPLMSVTFTFFTCFSVNGICVVFTVFVCGSE